MSTWKSIVEREEGKQPTWEQVRAGRLKERRYPYCPIKRESLVENAKRKVRNLGHDKERGELCKALWDYSYGRTREKLKWKHERMEKGFSEYDWWSIDIHFARMIALAARKYRDEGHGYPMMTDKDGEQLAETFAVQKWNNILTEMADGFDGYVKETLTADSPEFKRAMKLFSKWFGALWD